MLKNLGKKEVRIIWVEVPDFPSYLISDEGVVKRASDGHVIRQYQTHSGLVFVTLWRDGVQYNRGMAKLVASTFIPNHIEQFDTPINLNGDRWDNSELNLAWRPRWFAVMYNRQFHENQVPMIDEPIVELSTKEVFRNSLECAIAYGLLEADLVMGIEHRTYVLPSYKQFGILAPTIDT